MKVVNCGASTLPTAPVMAIDAKFVSALVAEMVTGHASLAVSTSSHLNLKTCTLSAARPTVPSLNLKVLLALSQEAVEAMLTLESDV